MVVVKRVLTFSSVGSFSYDIWKWRIDLADHGALRMPGGFCGDEITGRAIAVII